MELWQWAACSFAAGIGGAGAAFSIFVTRFEYDKSNTLRDMRIKRLEDVGTKVPRNP